MKLSHLQVFFVHGFSCSPKDMPLPASLPDLICSPILEPGA